MTDPRFARPWWTRRSFLQGSAAAIAGINGLAARFGHGAEIPDHNPLNPKYRMFISAWKKLPLPVANLLGPHIVRGVG